MPGSLPITRGIEKSQNRSKGVVVRFAPPNYLECLRLTASLAAYLVVAGCAAHKPAPPPTVTYPATSESALRELPGLPKSPYDRLAIITVAAEGGEQLGSAVKGGREAAAQKGANALVVLKEAEYLQKVGKRTLKVRRITYLAIHIR
jgi:hypothetical protein